MTPARNRDEAWRAIAARFGSDLRSDIRADLATVLKSKANSTQRPLCDRAAQALFRSLDPNDDDAVLARAAALYSAASTGANRLLRIVDGSDVPNGAGGARLVS